jgi:hypothetical protein
VHRVGFVTKIIKMHCQQNKKKPFVRKSIVNGACGKFLGNKLEGIYSALNVGKHSMTSLCS